MSELLIKGGLVVTPTEERFCDLLIVGNRIAALGTELQVSENCRVIDAAGAYVSPGLLDLQVNGGPDCDFWAELSLERVRAFCRRFLESGVTSFLPTLITGSLERLKTNRDFLKPLLGLNNQAGSGYCRMPGIHFEGPCLSPQRPGVHPVEHLQALELSVLEELIDSASVLMTLAPELDPSGDCLHYLKEHSVIASLGHSNASFEEARLAFSRGVNLVTHLFNAMPPLHHRQGGACLAALLAESVHCCLIPDGLHVQPEIIELVLKCKGVENTVLVSDIAAIGTSRGGLVGSSLVLDQGVRNLVEWGIAGFSESVRMASYNPACLLGLEDELGQIKPGAFADIVLWERQGLLIRKVIFDGAPVETNLAAPTC